MKLLLKTALICGMIVLLSACEEKVAVPAPGPETSNAPDISAHKLAMMQKQPEEDSAEAAGENTASDTGESTSSVTTEEKTDKVKQVETGRGTEDAMAVGRDTTDDKIIIEEDTQSKIVTVPKEVESGDNESKKGDSGGGSSGGDKQSDASSSGAATNETVAATGNTNTSAPVASGASSPAAAAPSREEGLALAKKSGCLVCHDIDKKVVGPPWMEVSKRYAGDSSAKEQLIEKVHKGGKGNWTEVTGGAPMPPYSPRVSDENIENLVSFVLSLAQQ
jgi:cytochrome c